MRRFIKKSIVICIFVVIIEAIFVIHEYGHYKEFQKRNIPIEEFSLGIGPTIYKSKINEDKTQFTIRAIPIMAYVLPGEYTLPFMEELQVLLAGIRNNLLTGYAIIIAFNILGWRRKNITTTQLLKRICIYPFKIMWLFVLFSINLITRMHFSLTKKCILYTGDIEPNIIIRAFLILSFAIGFFNLLPIYPLDGGRIFVEIFSGFMSESFLASFKRIGFFLIIFLFLTAKLNDSFIAHKELPNPTEAQ